MVSRERKEVGKRKDISHSYIETTAYLRTTWMVTLHTRNILPKSQMILTVKDGTQEDTRYRKPMITSEKSTTINLNTKAPTLPILQKLQKCHKKTQKLRSHKQKQSCHNCFQIDHHIHCAIYSTFPIFSHRHRAQRNL